jgi:hypothetical protein
METIIETKICKHCGKSFSITQADKEFYEKISPVFNGTKYLIPTPTFCPDCRNQRRLSFRNERSLYRRNDDLTKKPLILSYSPDKKYTVYSPTSWRSDQRNPMDYGKEFDFQRGFFEQFDEMLHKVPQL